MNLHSMYKNHFFICSFIVVFYYFFIKMQLFRLSGKIAIIFKLTKHYSFEMAKGAVELPFVVISHGIYIFIVFQFLGIHLPVIKPDFYEIMISIPEGILLGVGMMGFSSMLCRAAIEILRSISTLNLPQELKEWLIMTRSGWLRHYFHTIEMYPLMISLLIVLGQVCCEEMMFRFILIHSFLSNGPMVAIIASVILFMVMQLFHMPSLLSCIFPLIGSMVIGCVNGFLYLKYFNLFPLIIAHFTFFVAAVL